MMDELNLKQLALAVKTIADEKNLPEETVHEVIEQAIAAAWRRENGDREQDVRAELNSNSGDAKVYVRREVVTDRDEDGEPITLNDALEISLEDAKQQKPDAVLGDIIEEEQTVTAFGRVAAQTAKQVVLQRLREAEREIVLAEYEDKIGQVLTGIVQRVEPRVIRVELGKATGIIPPSEQIQGEYVSPGSRIKVYLKDIERDNRGPQLILSRASEKFIEYLFMQEVPELESGAVEVKAIAREAGRRTKIAVASSIPGVDPVGTLVGGHGTRVQAVMNEVGDQEKIDIIVFSDDPVQFIKNALSPAEVQKIELEGEGDHKRARVSVDESQQSIAIGRGGQNVRLASRLTGYEIDINPAERSAAGKPADAPSKSAESKPRKNIEDELMSAVEESTEEE